MKRCNLGFACCLFFVFIICCTKSTNMEENKNIFKKSVLDTLPFDFNNTINTFNDFFIDDKLAFEIGIAILKKVYGEIKISNCSFFVTESSREGVFIVTALPYHMALGGDYSVAINKKDGKILKIWMGE